MKRTTHIWKVDRDLRGRHPAAAKPSTADRRTLILEIIERCTAAKNASDAANEKFLGYMLAMTLEEARNALAREESGP